MFCEFKINLLKWNIDSPPSQYLQQLESGQVPSLAVQPLEGRSWNAQRLEFQYLMEKTMRFGVEEWKHMCKQRDMIFGAL